MHTNIIVADYKRLGSWENERDGLSGGKIAEDGGPCEPWQGTWALMKRREDQGSITDFAGSLLSW